MIWKDDFEKIKIKCFIVRLSDIFIQENTSKLKEKKYLDELYSLVENTEYKTQNYLNVISSPQLQNIYPRVRTNSSRLSPNPYSEISDSCTTCGVVKNFKHVLLHCREYNNERNKFTTQLRNAGCNLDPRSENFYRAIMSLELSDLSKETITSVTPVILSYVGGVGRKCVI